MCGNRTENVREQEDTQQQSGARSNTSVDQVFSMFKTYLEDRIEEQSKDIVLKGKAEKEVVQLKYKGNQKQFELNAERDSILDNIQKENHNSGQNPRIGKLLEEAKQHIRRRQKLIKIADRNKDRGGK